MNPCILKIDFFSFNLTNMLLIGGASALVTGTPKDSVKPAIVDGKQSNEEPDTKDTKKPNKMLNSRSRKTKSKTASTNRKIGTAGSPTKKLPENKSIPNNSTTNNNNNNNNNQDTDTKETQPLPSSNTDENTDKTPISITDDKNETQPEI